MINKKMMTIIMECGTYRLSLSFNTQESEFEEHTSVHTSLTESLEYADDLAFSTVGFPIECWKNVDLGFGNIIYWFYPNEEDMTSRYKLTISCDGSNEII